MRFPAPPSGHRHPSRQKSPGLRSRTTSPVRRMIVRLHSASRWALPASAAIRVRSKLLPPPMPLPRAAYRRNSEASNWHPKRSNGLSSSRWCARAISPRAYSVRCVRRCPVRLRQRQEPRFDFPAMLFRARRPPVDPRSRHSSLRPPRLCSLPVRPRAFRLPALPERQELPPRAPGRQTQSEMIRTCWHQWSFRAPRRPLRAKAPSLQRSLVQWRRPQANSKPLLRVEPEHLRLAEGDPLNRQVDQQSSRRSGGHHEFRSIRRAPRRHWQCWCASLSTRLAKNSLSARGQRHPAPRGPLNAMRCR
jgi:hypothetical protein